MHGILLKVVEITIFSITTPIASMPKTVSKNPAIFSGFDFKHFIFAQTLC
jgi:hypothetical protein